MPGSRPVVLFVPGISEGTKPFERVSSLLREQGYTVDCIQPPTTGRPNDTDTDADIVPTWQDNFAAVHKFVSGYVYEGLDVVLVCHSAGGIFGTAGVVGLEKPSRVAQGLEGGVVRFVFLTAGVAHEGLKQPDSAPFLRTVGERIYMNDPVEMGFNDLPKDQAEHWASQLTHEPLRGTAGQEATYTGWQVVPSTYLVCENDKILPPEYQRMVISGIKDAEVVSCDAAHFVIISQPQTVVDLVLRICREEEAKAKA